MEYVPLITNGRGAADTLCEVILAVEIVAWNSAATVLLVESTTPRRECVSNIAASNGVR